jgi:phosphate transport system substrate-binding protein
MMQRWTTEYQKIQSGTAIDYQSIGSGGGVKGFVDKTVDFAASDAPLGKKDIAAAGGPEDIIEFPAVSGGVVPAYHLSAVKAELKFSGPVLADIFMGAISKWNDPKIAALNPGVDLPDLVITPAWRTDGSGTTFIFTNYLVTQSDDFKSTVGAGKQVKWPAGQGGKGNEGVTAVVQNTDGGIGYIEQAYADKNNIPYGSVQNKAGKFVKASPASVSAAGEGAAKAMQGDLLASSLWNQDGDDAYPISGFTYIFIYKDLKNVKSKEEAQALVDFLSWATHDGQKMTTEMDYAPLSDAVVQKVDASLAKTTWSGAPISAAK